MPHISLPEGLPGILGPLAFRLKTAKPRNELADVLLRGPNPLTAADKLKARLAIAGKVQRGGKNATIDIERARKHGATDLEIHDTVLIAAAFCMYNRYVDGLATLAPTDQQVYRESGARLAEVGYQETTAAEAAP